MASLYLKNLSKTYPGRVTAVRDFSLEIKDQEFLILVGPSGCGKTTVLRMIAGLEEISSGELYIDDRLVNDVAAKDRDIAMVFQNYALYSHLSVYDNMAFGLKLRKIPKAEIRKNVQEAARILALEDLLKRKPKELSGGQRQRVALGRAIVRKPKVFLMDEPLSNLDARLRAQMRIEIAKLHKNLQTTFIYVTHDQTEAMTMGTRIVVMKDGLIQQIDSPQSIYDHPVNMFVAGFLGNPGMNFLEVLIIEQNGCIFTKLADALLPVPTAGGQKLKEQGYLDQEVVLGIRAEHLCGSGDFLDRHPECALRGRLEFTELRGAETYHYVSIAGREVVVRVSPELRAKTGQEVRVGFNMSKAHFFDQESGVNVSLLNSGS
ncbi:MAG: Trehalose import ATP-binding protein SugC [Pelotomaculum sp. PtaB.Bin013]|uniref:Sn-glycerol-3-phosphate ABC transporter ATP-binding protein UgpC n=1 Tax=Pelotomaculum isophthalicicum JI TaxID=947010 RepID=A0A9X4JU41_9FIRM|nr:sn-glycerol-3-phosphate ABC transporter ATP-binding protein UgpC [Pelotomaculum isophthalicicum]MDF9408440.1 sn-glycerol-3-phosphate ABC transporter ATP-binding protein UgpC [Pelotomaculum isophthalicicum JI]OPX89812.1 MAG: Trehalose import ATP-binding protein SugC [Pelotomaculum sp. PtaB.Bin013]